MAVAVAADEVAMEVVVVVVAVDEVVTATATEAAAGTEAGTDGTEVAGAGAVAIQACGRTRCPCTPRSRTS